MNSKLVLDMLADAALRSTALALLAGAILAACRVRDSRMRHAVWTLVLAAMLAIPVLTNVVPPLAVPLPMWSDRPDPESPRKVVRPAGPMTSAADRSDRSDRSDLQPVVAVSARLDPPTVGLGTDGRFTESALVILWLFGALALLGRCIVGWRESVRLTRSATPVVVAHPVSVTICESDRIVVPATTGIIQATILVPLAWRTWPDDQLSAVLAHESAHIRRRDSLVGLLATLNRAIFWFHPLAWWLERTLAMHAEYACDAEAARVVNDPRRYAALLVDMAHAVQRSGRRVIRYAVGVNGSRLDRRIDRVLDTSAHIGATRTQKLSVIASCALATLLAVACRTQSTRFDGDAAIEQRDRRLRAALEAIESSRSIALWRYLDITTQRFRTLERGLAENPDDLTAAQEILAYYWTRPDFEKRRGYIFRLIERRPESDLAGSALARIVPTDLEPDFPGDPIGYQRARDLWLAHTSRSNASAKILVNASAFFESSDKPLAESLLLRLARVEPNGDWRLRLGRFYARALAGELFPYANNRARWITTGEPRSAFGTLVRQQLGESRDELLLTAAGWFLLRSSDWRRPEFDAAFWAESCLKRVLQMNPQGVLAHTELLYARRRQNNREPLWRVPPIHQYESVAAMPEEERFEALPHRASNAVNMLGVSRWNDPNLNGRIELAREQAKRYAEDALRLAPKYTRHPAYGTAIYFANMTLGALALSDGDVKKAVGYLRTASEAPASEELAYSDDVVSQIRLARDLLTRGERDAVATFLDRMARINIANRSDLLDKAAAIRRGETPKL